MRRLIRLILGVLPLLLFFSVILAANSFALGIASDFLVNNTMELEKGESKLYGVRIQNPQLDVKRVVFGFQSDIAKVVDYKEVYEFSEEQRVIPILINITAPKNAHRGQEFTVGYYIEPVEVPGQGLSIKTRIDKGFTVRIKEQRWFSFAYSYSYIHLIIAIYILIAILIAFFLLRKPKKKVKSKSRRKRR